MVYYFGESNTHEITNLGKKTSWKGTRVYSRKTGSQVAFEYFNAVNLNVASMPSDQITILDSTIQSLGAYALNPLSTGPPPEFQIPMPAVITDRLGNRNYHQVVRIGTSSNGQLQSLVYSGMSGTAMDYMVSTRHIKKITFAGGTVTFEQLGGLLTAIMVHDSQGQLIRSIEFMQSQNSTNARVKLSEIRFRDRNGDQVEKYVFDYNGDLPVGWSSRSIDYWGFYNAASNTGTLLPPMQVSGVNFSHTGGPPQFYHWRREPKP